MNRRRFFQAVSALGLPALVPAAVAGARAWSVRVQESPVAGFQYHDGETVWSRLREGDRLTLVREPDNSLDARAVRIDWHRYPLGDLPRVENTAVSQMLDRGEPLVAHIQRLREARNPWARVRVVVEYDPHGVPRPLT